MRAPLMLNSLGMKLHTVYRRTVTRCSAHRPRGSHLSVKSDYDTAYGHWDTDKGPVPVASQFRIAWREFAATTGFRTLYPAVIPPGTRHIHAVNSCRHPSSLALMAATGAFMSSILADYFVRSAGTGHIFNDLVRGLPFAGDREAMKRIAWLFLRLNCLTRAYAPLWEEITGETWTPDVPIRTAWDRQHAQIEIDALVALSLGVSAEELCMIYRTQFPVMRRYDQEDLFDAHGRLVPKAIAKAEALAASPESLNQEDRTWAHPQSGSVYVFEYPFRHLDREQEIKEAFLRVKS